MIPEKLSIVDADTLLSTPLEKTLFIVEGLIPQGVTLLGGSSKIGKSWLMLSLGLRVARGLPLWGLKTTCCDVLYLSLEDTMSRLQNRLYRLTDEALDAIVVLAGGDGRAALTSLELAAGLVDPGTPDAPAVIDRDAVGLANPHRNVPYDKNKDMHYDIISAFIKSMRGSDPDATLYWLARMIDAGEDPKFIARRIMIHASEDVGNADPQALLVAEAAFKSAEVIGYPECRINLAQAALYVALAPKSNACEAGIDAALAEVRSGPRREVPAYLRDRHRPGSEDYGDYLYPHDFEGGWVPQRYLPEGLSAGDFFFPSPRGWEAWRLESTERDRAARTADGGRAAGKGKTNG